MTRRSLYLVPTTPKPSNHLAATLTTSLLSLAEQASTLAFTLVAACVPGIRQAPRAGVKVPSSPAIDGAQVEDAKRRRRVITDVEEHSSANIVEVSDAPHTENAAAAAPEFRAALVNRVRHFTTTRMSRLSSPVVAPPAPSPLDEDPFSSPPYHTRPTSTKPGNRPNPETLHVLALARTQVLSIRGTQNSPTPALRHTSRGDRRSGLRQHTVFFQQPQPQPQSPTQKQTPPKFWQPHPAGKRSCAVPIKAPAGKENCSML
uniref:Uncharacterized protein n=1 Tax=Mycena chlorophos TaxID=658473 RepID=A0ABQ0LQG2_MYCCL|nr:predicted protein [Mycena chlorophos]